MCVPRFLSALRRVAANALAAFRLASRVGACASSTLAWRHAEAGTSASTEEGAYRSCRLRHPASQAHCSTEGDGRCRDAGGVFPASVVAGVGEGETGGGTVGAEGAWERGVVARGAPEVAMVWHQQQIWLLASHLPELGTRKIADHRADVLAVNRLSWPVISGRLCALCATARPSCRVTSQNTSTTCSTYHMLLSPAIRPVLGPGADPKS